MAANIFTGATNSNWGTATNWSLAAVPTAADTNIATFNAASPNCTVNVTAVCNNIDFTGYTNTITMTNGITVSGNVTFVSTMASRVAGSGSLTINGTSAIVTNGATWNNALLFPGSGTKTITGTLTVTGLFTSVASNQTVNGGALILNGGMTITGNMSGGNTPVTLGGGTWSGTAFLGNPLTFAGNSTISGTVTYGGNTITYTSGIITTTGSTVSISNCTLNVSGITFNNVTLSSANTTQTLLSNLNIGGLLTVSGTNNNIFNGAFTINAAGGITVATGSILLGTSSIVLSGGTWSGAGTIRNNLTFNSAGTITVSGAVNYNTGVLTYTAGTMAVTSSTLNLTLSATLNTSGMTWNNITFNTTSQTCTLSSNLNLSGTLTFANLTMTTTINGAFSINCSGSVTHANGNTVTGTCLGLNLTGTGTYINNGTNYQLFPLTINTAGAITFSANININATTFTYTAGTVIWTGSTLNTQGAGTVLTLGTQVINNLVMGGLATYTVTLSADLNVAGNASMGTLGPLTVNGFTLKIGGNLTISNNVTISGTTTFLLNGTGTWSCNSTGIIQNNLTINTAGTITISGIVYYNTGALTYTTGTVVVTGSTLTISASTTLNTNGIIWNNITFLSVNSTITLSSDLRATGTITHTNITTITFNGFNFYIGGNVTLSNGRIFNGTTKIIFNTSTSQNISVDNALAGGIRNNLDINATGTVNIIYLGYGTGTLTYISGTVVTAGGTLSISTSATLNASSVTWNNVVLGSNLTLTLGSNLNISGTFTPGIYSLTFAGAYNATIANLSVGGGDIVWVANQTYTVTTSLIVTGQAINFSIWTSSIPTSAYYFTLSPSATQDNAFLSGTDANSSGGQTINTYKGTILRTVNWRQLPTDFISTGFIS
jgi:hypothetical protein